MTDQVTSTGRTCSTSIIQRDVSHAHGQSGSNQNSADVRGTAVLVALTPQFCHWCPLSRARGRRRRRSACEDGGTWRNALSTPDTPRRSTLLPGKNLTRDEAIARAAAVTVDHYDVALDLTTSETTFRTTTT